MATDAAARLQALDPSQSYIVQAPAGSGKTALLVYRILTLLTIAQKPEEVLAITFTRKATAEMRERLLSLLAAAEVGLVVDDEFEQQGIDLASRVLQRDQQLDWQLLNSPEQLQLQTIDSFCAKLSGDMPWLSRLGDRPNTTDQADTHYAVAVEQLFRELLQPDSSLGKALSIVMLELDFDYARARRLFTAMLSKRDQWLRHLVQNQISELRTTLENAWQLLVDEAIHRLNDTLPRAQLYRLIALAKFAAEHLDQSDTPLAIFLHTNPQQELGELEWRGLIHLLTTANAASIRKVVNKNLGFPKEEKTTKAKITTELGLLADNAELLEALQELAALPKGKFSDTDWQQLVALEEVLLKLAALLQLRFRATGECDYSEVAQRANLALAELETPTDLGLRMDFQLKHILVDEFQDTSRSQLELLRNLTAGWEPHLGDQRTLFLVGDPMQSIYRFREAEVSLFIQVANNSATQLFANLEINSLRLTENFRSRANLVKWFNHTFKPSFPAANEVLTGAVCYADSQSSNASDGQIKLVLAHSREQEAMAVVSAVKEWLNSKPGQPAASKLAILVRTRSHLVDLLPALDNANIPYSGVDIAPLKEAPAVIDLLTLCKALCRLHDRTSWLALLRGPWLGLSLRDLHLVSADLQQPIWLQLCSAHNNNQFDLDTHKRTQRFVDIVNRALAQRQQVPLHTLTRWTWQTLGGKHLLQGSSTHDIDRVLQCIQQLERGGDLPSISELETATEKLFAQTVSTSTEKIIVSTVHKAKGLQYDTVILPGLDRQPRSDDKDLLMWTERITAEGDAALLLAPIRMHAEKGQHFNYLRRLETRRGREEMVRVMYVACTRAERELVLTASHQQTADEQIKAPASSSLLSTVWEVLETSFDVLPTPQQSTADDTPIDQTLYRLPVDFVAPTPDSFEWITKHAPEAAADENGELEFSWATELAAGVGTVLHNWLETNGERLFSTAITEPLKQYWRAELLKLRVPHNRLAAGVARLQSAVEQMQQDPHAKFVFSSHSQQQNEYGITALLDGELKSYRLDRTFVDENDVRWIIDYKSTASWRQDVAAFVDEQVAERHRPQLEKYGELMSALDSRQIMLAVYFPVLGEFRSWPFNP